MAQITLDIKDCSECPFVKSNRCYTSDSFEYALDYFCSKLNRKIAGYIEAFDKMPSIPDDCPIINK